MKRTRALAVALAAEKLHALECAELEAKGGEEGVAFVSWDRLPEWAQAVYELRASEVVKALLEEGLLMDGLVTEQWRVADRENPGLSSDAIGELAADEYDPERYKKQKAVNVTFRGSFVLGPWKDVPDVH